MGSMFHRRQGILLVRGPDEKFDGIAGTSLVTSSLHVYLYITRREPAIWVTRTRTLYAASQLAEIAGDMDFMGLN